MCVKKLVKSFRLQKELMKQIIKYEDYGEIQIFVFSRKNWLDGVMNQSFRF